MHNSLKVWTASSVHHKCGGNLYGSGHYLASLQWKEGEDRLSALAIKLWTYEDTIATPSQAHVSAVETELAKHVQNREEKIYEGYQKLREEFKE